IAIWGRIALRGALCLGRCRILPGRLEQGTPRFDVRSTPQQRPPLPFSHPAPDPPFDLVVQRLGQALQPNRAPAADLLRPVLFRPADEEGVRPEVLASGLTCPVVLIQDHRIAPSTRTNRVTADSHALP